MAKAPIFKMDHDAFRTKTGKPMGLRVTLSVEAATQAELEKALDEAVKFGKARYMGIAYHWKKKPHVRVTCRTARTRKRDHATN